MADPSNATGDAASPHARYVAEIDQYEKESREWRERVKRVVKRYKDIRSPREESVSRFNVLWSNVQTLQPALYARNPKPDVSRRFNDNDPIGRVAADVLERSCTYFAAQDDFGQSIRQAVLDYLLGGRGVVWLRYVPHFRDATVAGPNEVRDDGAQVTDDADSDDAKPSQVIAYEEVVVDYVHWEDFGHGSGRTWEENDVVWRKAYMTRQELIERFPDHGKDVPLDRELKDAQGRPIDGATHKATIYEMWSLNSKKACWFHKDYPKLLDERDDPLRLKGFFPCPRPLFANLANDTLIPTPDFTQYQDQAVQLDELTSRIASITKSLKVAGVYDASAQGIARLLAEGVENQLLPVDQWAVFAEKGGIKGAVDFLPLESIATALKTLYEARDHVKAELYEITGLADIIRGNSDPRETATAQQIKGQFASLRLTDRQTEVQRFARDIVRIMGEIVANHFQIDTLKKISGVMLLTAQEKQMAQPQPNPMGGQPLPPALPMPAHLRPDEWQEMLDAPSWDEVGALLKDEPGRSFRIDIETDSTIKMDRDAEKAARVEFLKAVGSFLKDALPAGQQQPDLIPTLSQMLMFGIRAFPVGKDLEQTFNSYLDKVERGALQQKPDPEAVKMQGQAQLEQVKAQNAAQLEQVKVQGQAQIEQVKAQSAMQLEQVRGEVQVRLKQIEAQADMAVADRQQAAQQAQFEAQTRVDMAAKAADADRQAALARFEAEMRAQADAIKSNLENEARLAIAKLDNETKIIVAEIAADAAAAKASVGPDGKPAPSRAKSASAQAVEIGSAVAAALEGFKEALGQMSKPRSVVRDANGKIVGVQ